MQPNMRVRSMLFVAFTAGVWASVSVSPMLTGATAASQTGVAMRRQGDKVQISVPQDGKSYLVIATRLSARSASEAPSAGTSPQALGQDAVSLKLPSDEHVFVVEVGKAWRCEGPLCEDCTVGACVFPPPPRSQEQFASEYRLIGTLGQVQKAKEK